jgi:hypothetical protein
VSKHRAREDDDTTLLPRAVEQPDTAGQPDAVEQRPRALGRQPIVIAVATMCLLVSGAAAWALAKPTPSTSQMMPPGAIPSATGAGYVDGFGVIASSPAAPPAAEPARPSASATASAAASARPSTGGGSPAVRPSLPTAVPPAGPLSATYDFLTWQMGFRLRVWVRNTGTEPLDWTVRLRLPEGATLVSAWEANHTRQGDTWIFTPPRGALAPGSVHEFGFVGARDDKPLTVTCTVNDVPCQPA